MFVGACSQTQTHICLITDFCPGGELFLLLERQPRKVFTEEVARFFAAEIVVALEYLHCVGKKILIKLSPVDGFHMSYFQRYVLDTLFI